jgi:hypothetical protein
MSKDHKDIGEDGTRPAGPVCHARESPNIVTSDLLSEISEAICENENQDTECANTEEMCAKIREAYKIIKDKDY